MSPQSHPAISELEQILDSNEPRKVEINSDGSLKTVPQDCLNDDANLFATLEFLRNPDVVWYGPHACNKCGEMIVKSSFESGGMELDADDANHHYPNFRWQRHICHQRKIT